MNKGLWVGLGTMLLTVACSNSSSDSQSNDEALSKDAGAAPVDPNVVELAKAIHGLWTTGAKTGTVALGFPAGEGGGPIDAQSPIILFGAQLTTMTVEAKGSDKGKLSVNDFGDTVKVVSATSKTEGVVTVSHQDFSGAKPTTVTKTSKVSVKDKALTMIEVLAGGKDGDKTTLSKVDSFCGRTSFDDGRSVCGQIKDRFWTPSNVPDVCKDDATACIRCVKNACQTVEISSCEASGRICVESSAACEFNKKGEPVGQVAGVDRTSGKTLNCDNSSTGKTVCCDPLFGQPDQ